MFCFVFQVLACGGFPPDTLVSWKGSSMSRMASIPYTVIWRCQCRLWCCGWVLGVSSSSGLVWTFPHGRWGVNAARETMLHSEALFTCSGNSSVHMRYYHVPEARAAHTNKPGSWHGASGQGKSHDHMDENDLWPLLYSTTVMWT